MIRVYNCTTDLEFRSVREACLALGIYPTNVYNKGLPCEHGGFFFEAIEPQGKKHICCKRCGQMKWDVDFVKASYKLESGEQAYQQPCKTCKSEKRKEVKSQSIYDPNQSRKHYAY